MVNKAPKIALRLFGLHAFMFPVQQASIVNQLLPTRLRTKG